MVSDLGAITNYENLYIYLGVSCWKTKLYETNYKDRVKERSKNEWARVKAAHFMK